MAKVKGRSPRRARRERGTYRLADKTRPESGVIQQRAKKYRVTRIGKDTAFGEPKAWVWDAKGERMILTSRDYARRPRQWKGAVKNAELNAKAPGPWIDDRRCRVCGEQIANWRAGVSWEDGQELMRQAAATQGDPSGGYRTRGPVLWAMHILKVREFYDRHLLGGCGELWSRTDGQVPLPRPVIWACYYGAPDTVGSDCELYGVIAALVELGRQRPSSWPAQVVDQVEALQSALSRPNDLPRLEALPLQDAARTRRVSGWTEDEVWTAVTDELAAQEEELAGMPGRRGDPFDIEEPDLWSMEERRDLEIPF